MSCQKLREKGWKLAGGSRKLFMEFRELGKASVVAGEKGMQQWGLVRPKHAEKCAKEGDKGGRVTRGSLWF